MGSFHGEICAQLLRCNHSTILCNLATTAGMFYLQGESHYCFCILNKNVYVLFIFWRQSSLCYIVTLIYHYPRCDGSTKLHFVKAYYVEMVITYCRVSTWSNLLPFQEGNTPWPTGIFHMNYLDKKNHPKPKTVIGNLQCICITNGCALLVEKPLWVSEYCWEGIDEIMQNSEVIKEILFRRP